MREKIQNVIILKLQGLKFSTSPNPIFHEVKKIFVNFPAKYPVCEVVNEKTEYNIADNASGEITYYFNVFAVDDFSTIENSEAEINKKIERMNSIEEILLKFFLKLPTEINIAGLNILSVAVENSIFNIDSDDVGFKIILQMNLKIRTLQNLRT